MMGMIFRMVPPCWLAAFPFLYANEVYQSVVKF
jgi:hypothetical protein